MVYSYPFIHYIFDDDPLANPDLHHFLAPLKIHNNNSSSFSARKQLNFTKAISSE